MARNIVRAMVLTVAGMGVPNAAFSQSGEGCDRDCLTGFVDQYLKAMVAHEPGRAQLAKTAKLTENGQVLKPGDGLWATVTEDASYRLYAADPQAGQVAFIGVMKENGAPVILGLRLRIENRQITQAESVVARNDPGTLFRPELLMSPKLTFLEPLASDERLARENLLGIVNVYFDGLDELDSGRRVPFDKECQRVENGIEVAGSFDANAEPMRRLGCQEQFNTGFSKAITAVRERRFLIVDEERGLVFVVSLHDHAGLIKTMRLNDGTTWAAPPSMLRPMSYLTAELFKIKDGKLRQVESVKTPVPYGMRSGWTR